MLKQGLQEPILFYPNTMKKDIERNVEKSLAKAENKELSKKAQEIEPFEGDQEKALALKLLKEHDERHKAWKSHFTSFLAVNLGLFGINVLSSIGAESFYPWFLYVVSSWGIGFMIHGLNHRGWLKDRLEAISQAERLTGRSRHGTVLVEQIQRGEKQEDIPQIEETAPPSLPASEEHSHWTSLLEECRTSLDSARKALKEARPKEEILASMNQQLDEAFSTVETVYRGAQRILAAMNQVAPQGAESLEGEIKKLDQKIESINDDRLKNVYEVNKSLLEARFAKINALKGEEERMRATVKGFVLSAQNIQLDAARLGAGFVPDLVSSFENSLEKLNQEVEIVRQVERELDQI